MLRVDKITRKLRTWLLDNFSAGDSLPGDRELSRQFNVSTITIWKSMQALVEEGVVERRPRSGTYMCDRRDKLPVALVTGINILHPNTAQFWPRITGALRDKLRERHITQELFIGHSVPGEFRSQHDLPEEFLQAVEKQALRAVILVNVFPDPQWLDKLEAAKIPVIGYGGLYRYGVDSSRETIIRRAVRQLYAQGRRRFAIITQKPFLYNSKGFCQNTLDIFCNAVKEVGLETRPEWIGLTDHPGSYGAGWEETREIWIANPKERPDALFITDEALFANVSVALLEMRVDVPRELHVVTQMNYDSRKRLPFPVSRYEVNFNTIAEAMTDLTQKLVTGNECSESLHIDVPIDLYMLEGNSGFNDVHSNNKRPLEIEN